MAAPQPSRPSAAPGRRVEQQRLMIKVARLYHEHDVLQPEIARRLHISQARVSRLLKQAQLEGIVRTTVVVPEGVRTELEELLEEAYGLREAMVVDCLDFTERGIAHDLGMATATYLEATLTGGDIVGISSWSATLLAAVDAMRRMPRVGGGPRAATRGRRRRSRGRGSRGAAHAALRRAHRSSADVPAGARDRHLGAGAQGADAGSVREGGARGARRDHARARRHRCARALELSCRAAATSSRPASSPRSGSAAPWATSACGSSTRTGARSPPRSTAGSSASRSEQLRRADRSVGVAGGERKYEAIRGALLGRWVNVLITDQVTAERLVADRPAAGA